MRYRPNYKGVLKINKEKVALAFNDVMEELEGIYDVYGDYITGDDEEVTEMYRKDFNVTLIHIADEMKTVNRIYNKQFNNTRRTL